MPMLPFERIHILPFVAKEFGAEDRTVWLTVSTVLRDRQKEIVTPEALRESLPRYMNNPVWTFQHKQEWPVGHAVDYTVGEEETALKVFISEASETSRMVWGMINDRTLRAASFGFNAYSKSFGPHPDGTPDFAQEESAAGPVLKWLRMDYMESAVVTIPANQGAVRAFAKGLGLDLQVIFPEQDKAVTAFADLPLAPEETPWEWSAGGGATGTRMGGRHR